MPRTPRTRVPDLEQPPTTVVEPENEDEADDEGDDTEREEVLTDVGDVAELADARYTDWNWWIYRVKDQSEMAKNPRGKSLVIVTRVSGPLDIMRLRADYGGGVYQVWGFFGGVLRMKRTYELEGPRKVYDTVIAVPAPAPAPLAPAGPNVEDRIGRMLEHFGHQLELIAVRAAANPPAAPAGLSPMDALNFADRIAQRATPPPAGDLVKEIMEAFRAGIEMRADLEGAPGKSTTEVVLERLAPLLEKVATAMVTARRPAPPGRIVTPPPGSTPVEAPAWIVEPAPQEPTDMDSVRMMSAVDALARAVSAGIEPQEFAISLETMLSPEQITILKVQPEDSVVASLFEATGGQYKILATDHGKAYMQAVLTALKSETEPEVGE